MPLSAELPVLVDVNEAIIGKWSNSGDTVSGEHSVGYRLTGRPRKNLHMTTSYCNLCGKYTFLRYLMVKYRPRHNLTGFGQVSIQSATLQPLTLFDALYKIPLAYEDGDSLCIRQFDLVGRFSDVHEFPLLTKANVIRDAVRAILE